MLAMKEGSVADFVNLIQVLCGNNNKKKNNNNNNNNNIV